jgi:hypothetical protein
MAERISFGDYDRAEDLTHKWIFTVMISDANRTRRVLAYKDDPSLEADNHRRK